MPSPPQPHNQATCLSSSPTQVAFLTGRAGARTPAQIIQQQQKHTAAIGADGNVQLGRRSTPQGRPSEGSLTGGEIMRVADRPPPAHPLASATWSGEHHPCRQASLEQKTLAKGTPFPPPLSSPPPYGAAYSPLSVRLSRHVDSDTGPASTRESTVGGGGRERRLPRTAQPSIKEHARADSLLLGEPSHSHAAAEACQRSLRRQIIRRCSLRR